LAGSEVRGVYMTGDREFAKVAIDAARRAGRLIVEQFGTKVSAEYKGDINVVTEVDKASEEAIVNILLLAFPDHGILAEEGDYCEGSSRYRWIIDPLDGTVNYLHGYPHFCVSIALQERGITVLGVVYCPTTGELFVAEKGAGALCNDRPIRVSRTPTLHESLLVTGFPYDVRQRGDNYLVHFGNFIRRAQGVRRDGVAALDLCYVAMGRFDGMWEFGLFPWDVAAGSLAVAEAGGLVSLCNGSPLDIHAGQIVASNGKIHHELISVLREGPRAVP